MIFNKRNDPNQISKLIDFETRDFDQPSEEDISYNSISDLEAHPNTNNNNGFINNDNYSNSQILTNDNFNNVYAKNQIKSQYKNKSKKNIYKQNRNNNNSYNSQLSEYAIQRSFNENLQDKSDGNADSDCSMNFQSSKREYKPSKSPNFKTKEDFSTKKTLNSHYPSSENFHTKKTLSERPDSEHYIAPKKNKINYSKEDYISEKSEIENMFRNQIFLKNTTIEINTNNNSEISCSLMNTNKFLCGTSAGSVNNLATINNNFVNNYNLNSKENVIGKNFSYLNLGTERNNSNIYKNEDSNFYNNINNSVGNIYNIFENKEEYQSEKKEKTDKEQKINFIQTNFISENHNNFQSSIYYNRNNRDLIDNSPIDDNYDLVCNDLIIYDKIKNETENDYYLNYDSDPR